ncbi:MAG: tetratricopeptide repeat protein [Promethearchaeota archaeon]
MSSKVQKQLMHIRQLREQGEYNSAMAQLAALHFDQLPKEDQLTYKVLQVRLLIDLGDLNQAESILNEVKESSREEKSSLIFIDVITLQVELLRLREQMDKALELVTKALREVEVMTPRRDEEIKIRKSELLHQGGILYWYKGDFDTASDYHRQSLEIRETLHDKPGIASSLNNLGLVHWSKGELDQAIEFYNQALEVFEQLGIKRNIAVTLSNLGNCYTRLGALEKALTYQQRSLVLTEEIGNPHDIARSLLNLGVVFQFKGDLKQAQSHYEKSLEFSEKTGRRSDIALAINNLGNIFDLKGDLDQALEHFQRSLRIYEELQITESIALLLANIGGVYRKKGEYSKSQDYYQRSLKLYEDLGNDFLTAMVLFELVWIALEKQDSNLVESTMIQLKAIHSRAKNPVITQRFNVAQALILKSSKRTRQKIKAAEILETVVKEEVYDHSLTVTAMIHLTEVLLSELKLTGEVELISDIGHLSNQLLRIAKEQSSQSLLAETYLLQSKLALIEMDMGRANKLLTQAQAIADETGLDRLAQTLLKERKLLDSQIEKWDRIIKENPTKQELIELTKLDDLLERMIQETVTEMIDEQGLTTTRQKKKYQLEYLDFLADGQQHAQSVFRVGIAQIGLSHNGDILKEYYEEQAPGLFTIRKEKINSIRKTLQALVKEAAANAVRILAFPELTIDLNDSILREEVYSLAKKYDMYLIPGSYHKVETQQNISSIISPQGLQWEQSKHIPAIIHFQKKRITEGINTGDTPTTITIANTEFGRIAVIICRDFLDMDLRVELKNFEPPIDIIINPAFTPVTADFKATHFDARRSIYAYSFFVNVAEFGDSLIYSPEKDREERTIPKGKEAVIYKDIDLFKLRTARKKWEQEQHKSKSFIQSTR